MGKTKKFIPSKEGTTYNVVRRSQQDPSVLYEDDQAASNYVLVPAASNRNHAKHGKRREREEREDSVRSGVAAEDVGSLFRSSNAKDHINPLGLPDNGSYDYDKHLKSIGGGTFVGADGKVRQDSKRSVALPAEALAPDGEVERCLASITISEKVMDDDIWGILSGQVEEYEELDDDFVLQAAQEPEAGDTEAFDFDKHIAHLIAASEREVGIRRVQDYSDLGEGSEVESLSEVEEEGPAPSRGVEGDRMDLQFAAALAEYETDDEVDEHDYGAHAHDAAKDKAELWDPETNEYANACFDDFLREQADMNWFDGLDRNTKDEPRVYRGNKATDKDGGGPRLGKLRGLGGATDDVGREEPVEEEGSEDEDKFCPIDQTFDYFKPQPVEKWDCETIVSTYSNIDNHPTVLSVGKGSSKYKGKRAHEPAVPATGIIELSKKTGMPLGVLGTREKAKELHSKAESEAAQEQIRNAGEARAKTETAEERRERKAKVREEKREKREQKMALKTAFRDEGKMAAKTLSGIGSTQQSVFCYS